MGKIICDQFGIHHACEGDFIVTEADHYEDALNRLKKLQVQISQDIEQAEQNIVVRNPALFHWFDAPAKQFDCQIIKLDPVSELKKLLNQNTITDSLKQHPEWIIDLELLKKATTDRMMPNEHISMWIKRVLLGSVWQYEKLYDLGGQPGNESQISHLFNWLATHDEHDLHPLARTLIFEQLQTWGHSHPEKTEMFQWLRAAPFLRAKFVIWEQSLHQYPPNQVARWFQHDNIWYTLNLLPGRKQSIPEMNLQIQLPESVAVFIRTFLEEEWNRSPQEALSFMTGLLDAERVFLLQKLHFHLHQGVPLEKEIYHKISQLNQFPEVIALASQLIPIQSPSSLSDTASVETVQEWMRDQYLPFYRSCALLKKLELTIPYVNEFEHWMKEKYPDLLISGSGMAYLQIYQLKSRLPDGPVLLYLFDGMDYLSAKEKLLPALESMGAYPENDVIPYLAFLPTETFIAKPTLVCGLMNSQIMLEQPDALFYRKLLKDSLGVAEDEIRSATDKDATLEELIQEPAKVYLFLDNQLDRDYLHVGLSPYVRWKKYSAHIKKQAGAIVDAAKFIKEQYNKNLFVSICSDHGYTEFPLSVPIINAQPGGKTKTRSMLFADIPPTADETDRGNIWRLNAGLFGLNEDMAIPSGYGCFGKRPKGASHGGCTPQEVAVPWFSLTFQKPEPAKAPIITIEGEIFRRRKENSLIVTISNINNYPLSITNVAIESQTGEFEILTSFPLRIEQQQITKLQASFNAIKANDIILEFKVFCTFAQRHGKETIEILSKLETIGAMMNEFDDEFEL